MTAQKERQIQNSDYDWGLLFIVLVLLAFGLIMVFSASFAQAFVGYKEDSLYFMTRQVWWTAAGLGLLIIGARIPYHIWQRFSIPLMGLAMLTLLAVMFFGTTYFGAKRTFFSGSVQPSEPAKIIILIYVSAWLTSKGEQIRDVRVGLIPFGVLLGFVTVLIVAQPDISTSILIVSTALIMFFIAGADLRQLLVVLTIAATTFWLVVQNSVYAGNRVAKYMDSIWNPLQSEEWQVQNAIAAITRGGWTGVGLGNSVAKEPGHLPLGWSDNIFAIIGEEMGILGAFFVLFLFAFFAYRGLRTALNAQDHFGMLLATGITALLILQALLNVAVAVAVAPPTGVTLPFISYGGSSMVTALGAVGILLSISRGQMEMPDLSSRMGRLAYLKFNFGAGNEPKKAPPKKRSPKRAKPNKRTPQVDRQRTRRQS